MHDPGPTHTAVASGAEPCLRILSGRARAHSARGHAAPPVDDVIG